MAITWAECTVDWTDAETIGSVTHLPTGTKLEVNRRFGPDDDRAPLLDELEAKVAEAAAP